MWEKLLGPCSQEVVHTVVDFTSGHYTGFTELRAMRNLQLALEGAEKRLQL